MNVMATLGLMPTPAPFPTGPAPKSPQAPALTFPVLPPLKTNTSPSAPVKGPKSPSFAVWQPPKQQAVSSGLGTGVGLAIAAVAVGLVYFTLTMKKG